MTNPIKRQDYKRSIAFDEALRSAIDSYALEEGLNFSEAVRKLCEVALTSRPTARYNDIRQIVRDEVARGVNETIAGCAAIAIDVVGSDS